MTICIGLIPNDKTVMLLQDSEISFSGIGFTQDIFNKIKTIDDNSITGIIGNPTAANEVVDLLKSGKYNSSREFKGAVEAAYHAVRESKINPVLRKYGFNSMREFSQIPNNTQIDPTVREEILKLSNDADQKTGLELITASNIEKPQLLRVYFPGTSELFDNVKLYAVAGSGSIMAIDKMGEELKEYRWQEDLTIDEGIGVLMSAGKASEKHQGVGGPFDITYITKDKDGKNELVKPDQKKINMVMYLFPYRKHVTDEVMAGCIERMRNEDIKSDDLADYIKSNVKVGIEFDEYFGIE
ncbi:hypothetical protein ACFL6I_23380 [candidate division KSB1 bacterium]